MKLLGDGGVRYLLSRAAVLTASSGRMVYGYQERGLIYIGAAKVQGLLHKSANAWERARAGSFQHVSKRAWEVLERGLQNASEHSELTKIQK